MTNRSRGLILDHSSGRVRRRRGISQERMAEMLGCHRISIWRLEHGLRYPSSLFLRNLGLSYPLTESEAESLSKFIELRAAPRDLSA